MKTCPVCGSSNSRKYKSRVYHFELDFVDCNECGWFATESVWETGIEDNGDESRYGKFVRHVRSLENELEKVKAELANMREWSYKLFYGNVSAAENERVQKLFFGNVSDDDRKKHQEHIAEYREDLAKYDKP